VISLARIGSLLAILDSLWLECSQNPAVFCYRISWDLLAPLYKSLSGGVPPPSCSS
jgi:hypothetical protein